jgi:hypothetical protein
VTIGSVLAYLTVSMGKLIAFASHLEGGLGAAREDMLRNREQEISDLEEANLTRTR